MAGQKPKTARLLAMTVLNQFDPKHNYARPILNKLLHKTNEKQRATDLVFGTIRNRAAIDMVIAGFTSCPLERIPAKLLNIIRIGAYELIYCPQTSEYSIVNEAVESAKTTAGPVRSEASRGTAATRKMGRTSNEAGKKQTGFVNAVLRQITRHIKNRQAALTEASPKRTLPQTLSSGCEFDTDILPTPKTLPTDYFSGAFSLPKWLVGDWLVEFNAEQARQICFACNRKPSIYIRPNTLKTTTQELDKKFRQRDIDFETTPDKSMIKIKAARAVTELPGFAEGLFIVQDITASQPVRLAEPQPHWTMLDLCAAPGVKTTQLAEATGDSAKIIATDINGERLKLVKENTARLGISSISIVAYENLQKVNTEVGPFDCVLLDVPCSNTGVLAKRHEARYRIKPEVITELTKIQGKLLNAAATMIKPQGRIAYSTCSIQKSENSELVREFLLKNSNFKLESEKLTLPSAQGLDCDGGYVAIIAYSNSG